MPPFIRLLLVAFAVTACRQPPPAPVPTPGVVIAGTLVERLDGPPYSYLRLKTDQGEIWAAVPIAEVTKGGKVRVRNGAPVKNFEAKGIGRRFETVVFGVVERE